MDTQGKPYKEIIKELENKYNKQVYQFPYGEVIEVLDNPELGCHSYIVGVTGLVSEIGNIYPYAKCLNNHARSHAGNILRAQYDTFIKDLRNSFKDIFKAGE